MAIEIVDALTAQNIHEPFAIQQLCIPLALDGKDIIGQARTGTGKTLGFGIPLLDRVFDDAAITELDGTPRALVVVPTRELCLQVTQDLQEAASNLPVRITPIYGGVPLEPQTRTLRDGVDVIVGTPGRIIDHLEHHNLDLSTVQIVVLDEADEMLDQGFLEDVQRILHATSPTRQTMLFSATLPAPIMALSRTLMSHPVMIHADESHSEPTHQRINQIVFQSHKFDRTAALAKILQTPQRGRTIIFTTTKRNCEHVATALSQLGFRIGTLNGNMRQEHRERVLTAFRNDPTGILVATDVAARGIDIDQITHVINDQVPHDARTYVHRIGRTGRAGHTGTAITCVGWDEVNRWNTIAETLNLHHLLNPPQWFSTTPDFLAAMHLPTPTPEQTAITKAPTAKTAKTRRKDSRR